MKAYVHDVKHLELLTRTNQHDRLAGALGILPNHLIQLLRPPILKSYPKLSMTYVSQHFGLLIVSGPNDNH